MVLRFLFLDWYFSFISYTFPPLFHFILMATKLLMWKLLVRGFGSQSNILRYLNLLRWIVLVLGVQVWCSISCFPKVIVSIHNFILVWVFLVLFYRVGVGFWIFENYYWSLSIDASFILFLSNPINGLRGRMFMLNFFFLIYDTWIFSFC